jgi:hypothetical protein
MTTQAALLERVQALRVPVEQPGTPDDWKDWYHFVLLDLEHGTRAIANVALIGNCERGEVQTTLVAHLPDRQRGRPQAYGAATTREWRPGMVHPDPLVISAEGVSLAYRQRRFELRLDAGTEGIGLVLEARPEAAPLLVTEGAPFGSGFIGWGLVPGLAVSGALTVCGEAIALTGRWFCYQDHNFGRFRWGEDFGWEWLTAHGLSPAGEAITLVVDWRTNRSHSSGGLPYVFVYQDHALAKVFVGPALRMRWRWSGDAKLPLRLPGAMASVRAGLTASEPLLVEIVAVDERDRLEASIAIDGFVEIVAPDNGSTRCTRIGESTGSTSLAFSHGGRAVEARGWAYGEYTH